MRRAALAAAFLALSAAAFAVQFDNEGEAVTLYDRAGNGVTISNRFDGSAYSISLTSYNLYHNINWERQHQDDFQETILHAVMDLSGNVYMAGTRIWQGTKYLWAMKYSSQGQLLWERADVEPGCAALSVVPDEKGGAWVGGSCVQGDNAPVRLMRVASGGNSLWAQSYDGGGRNYVRNLTVDFAERAAVSIQVGSGYGSTPRTVVYDRYGNRLTVY
jgi:hypothetical protein